MYLVRTCMLRFPLNSIQVRLAMNAKQEYIFCIMRPSHPPLYFTYPVSNLSKGVSEAGKYLMGYCHVCDSMGEQCKEGKRLEDRPSNQKNLM